MINKKADLISSEQTSFCFVLCSINMFELTSTYTTSNQSHVRRTVKCMYCCFFFVFYFGLTYPCPTFVFGNFSRSLSVIGYLPRLGWHNSGNERNYDSFRWSLLDENQLLAISDGYTTLAEVPFNEDDQYRFCQSQVLWNWSNYK